MIVKFRIIAVHCEDLMRQEKSFFFLLLAEIYDWHIYKSSDLGQ